MKRILLSLAFLLLAGCASVSKETLDDLSAKLQQAEQAYVVVGIAAAAYRALPPCDAEHTVICRNDAIVAQIDKAVASLRDALDGAKVVVATLGKGGAVNSINAAATAAIEALKILQTYGVLR